MIPGELLFVHGGVSSRIRDQHALVDPSSDIVDDVLNSDCSGKTDTEEPNTLRGRGVRFGSKTSAEVCERLGVKRIVRGHQHDLGRARPGVTHNGRVVTVISSSVYVRRPYILRLDATEPSAGEILPLGGGKPVPINYEDLERSSIRASFREISPVKSRELRSALETIKKLVKLKTRGSLRSFSANGIGLPRPEANCEYFCASVADIDQQRKNVNQDSLLIVLVNTRERQIHDLYFAERGLGTGTIVRISK